MNMFTPTLKYALSCRETPRHCGTLPQIFGSLILHYFISDTYHIFLQSVLIDAYSQILQRLLVRPRPPRQLKPRSKV